MSNVLAVATVTQALKLMLSNAVNEDLSGLAVQVDVGKPPAQQPNEPTITVFCYRVSPNLALRSADTPTRAADGTLLTRPRAALDLHYLITFHHHEGSLVPEMLLGSVVRCLHEQPILSPSLIAQAADPQNVVGSDLPAALERVRFTPTHIEIDDLYKLWSMMSQTPYALSVSYQASLVVVDGRATAAGPRPVLRRNLWAVPGGRPAVSRLRFRATDGSLAEGPVPVDRPLVLDGTGLANGATSLQIGDTVVPVPASGARDTRVEVLLPADLPAGVRQAQVLVELPPGAGPHPVMLDSNVIPFVRQPRITGLSVVPNDRIDVTVDVPIGDRQRVSVVLDELDPPAGKHSRTCELTAPYPLGARPDPRTVAVPLGTTAPARYLARIRVDGAQSPLQTGPDGRFNGPLADLTGSA